MPLQVLDEEVWEGPRLLRAAVLRRALHDSALVSPTALAPEPKAVREPVCAIYLSHLLLY